ncbi:MAG TPA: SRPBCC family protein [Solirubrobacteraceae bacterium]|nr:SRPBCC family protein [Solirubrobacteraceae bacterium]
MSAHGTYATIDGRPAVRFERRLPHPVDAVWRAVTDPAELEHWFPCAVTVDLRPGGAMRFTFSADLAYDGEVVELDPPHRFAFNWGADLLRFELAADGDGTRLTLVHVLREEGADAAAKTAAGWHLCLDAMARRLAGAPAPAAGEPAPAAHAGEPAPAAGETAPGAHAGPSQDWMARYDEYRAAGLPSGAPVPGLDEAPAS